MWRPIRKVIGLPSLLQTTSFVDRILHIHIALSAKLEAANKALAKERATRQVADQALQASQEMGSALTRDLQYARAFADVLKEELSAKSMTLDELVIQEREAQIRLYILGDEKKAHEQLLEST
jgi:Asp-tRNA(Asn)/Glu-tRNA(Gln) amidotransferase B subunit